MRTLVLVAAASAFGADVALPLDAEAPWQAVVHSETGFAVEDSLGDTGRHAVPVFAVQGLDLSPGQLRSDQQGEQVLAAGAVHTVSSERAVWRLVPYLAGSETRFWDPDRYHLALVRTDLLTGEHTAQLLDATELTGPPILRWAGDLDADGELDLLIDDGSLALWVSGGSDELVRRHDAVTAPSSIRAL